MKTKNKQRCLRFAVEVLAKSVGKEKEMLNKYWKRKDEIIIYNHNYLPRKIQGNQLKNYLN